MTSLMRFKITRHSGFAAPENALDLVWPRLGEHHNGMSLAHVGSEIRVAVRRDMPVSMERDVREEVARLAVLDFLRKACRGAPELKLDWYTISPLRSARR